MTRKWVTKFQIRVEGAHGTTAGSVAELRDGVSVGLKGRLCSAKARNVITFTTKNEALEYVATRNDKDKYEFTVVEVGWWGSLNQ